MKKNIEKPIIILVGLVILFFILFGTNTLEITNNGDNTDFFLVDWDVWYEDTTYGENSFITWIPTTEETGLGDCIIKPHSGAFSGSRVLDFGGAGKNIGYGGDVSIQLKNPVINEADYNTWCFGIYMGGSIPYGSGMTYGIIKLYNSTNVMVHGWQFGLNQGNYNKFFNVWANDGWHMVATSYIDDYGGMGWFWLNTTFEGGVTFKSTVWSKQNQQYLGEYTGAWDFTPSVWNSSSDYQWSRIYMGLTTNSVSWGPYLYVYLDDIIISSQVDSDYGFIYRTPGDPVVTCYSCDGNESISGEFFNNCPNGWYSTPRDCSQSHNGNGGNGNDGDEWWDNEIYGFPLWLLLGLILSGFASVYIYYKKIKSPIRYIVYIIFIGFILYFIYIFM